MYKLKVHLFTFTDKLQLIIFVHRFSRSMLYAKSVTASNFISSICFFLKKDYNGSRRNGK